jgi:hypothetical protein
MLRSKHSGWTWEGKRTPFGSGGGIISDIGNAVSNAVSNVGSAIQNNVITPISNAGVAIDQAVNNTIPGGWVTVGSLAAGGAALAYAPEVMALADSAGITPEAASAQLGIAPVDASTGATVSLQDLGASSGTGLTGGAGGSTGLLTGGTTSGLTVPTGSAIAVDPSIAAGSGADLATAGTTSTGAATGAGLSGTSGLNPALPAAGANAGAGTGLSASLAPNTVLGTGLPGGGEIGVAYQLGASGLPAVDFLGNPIPASSVGLNGSTATSSLFPNPSSLVNALRKSGSTNTATNYGNSALSSVKYQSPWLTTTPSAPVEGSRLTTTPTALKLASLLQ